MLIEKLEIGQAYRLKNVRIWHERVITSDPCTLVWTFTDQQPFGSYVCFYLGTEQYITYSGRKEILYNFQVHIEPFENGPPKRWAITEDGIRDHISIDPKFYRQWFENYRHRIYSIDDLDL